MRDKSSYDRVLATWIDCDDFMEFMLPLELTIKLFVSIAFFIRLLMRDADEETDVEVVNFELFKSSFELSSSLCNWSKGGDEP